MFDLTPSIVLPESQKRLYSTLRVVLSLFFVMLAVLVALKIVFPSERGYFDFRIYSGGKNTIAEPRLEDGFLIEKGQAMADRPILFNMAATGSFSRAEITIHTESGSSLAGSRLEMVRSYRAFLYPEGDRVGFREGSLLESEGRYFIISSNAARKFSSVDVLKRMGYDLAQFMAVDADELAVNRQGDDITDLTKTIEGMIVRIDGVYYQLQGEELVSFVSDRAYRSRYRPEDALPKGKDLLDRYRVSDRMIGFVDGTLLSYGDSAYVVEGETLRPIDSPDTFIRKGYVWESVIAATGEEFGVYTRGKLFTIKQPHPDGTVYFYEGGNRYFLVDHGKKREIRGEHILLQYAAVIPVLVEAVLLEPRSCELKKGFLPETYWCNISIAGLPGINVGEYQFRLTPSFDATLRDIETLFIRDIDQLNARIFVDDLIRKLRSRYGEFTQ